MSDERAQPIQLNLTSLSQLYNTLDPYPFHPRELDRDAADYLFERAEATKRNDRIRVTISLPKSDEDQAELLPDAIRRYFELRYLQAERDLKRTLREGRFALVIGLLAVFIIIAISQLVRSAFHGALVSGIAEGMLILGWVALWRPAELLLHDWWPIARRKKLFRRLANMEVECRFVA